ncbi:MAG TPA: aminomethyl-transferring glycine dehydrogenase, partial [Intrasporangium sp.]|uniref:aminomethyl-transferring glycine dehydrogenase n=1 Tax=Intrasporangium sp. TaxID=1925024 RepID=UPI002B47D4BF
RKNRPWRSFLGLGYHATFTPPVIQRNVLENPGWYTQYTPYQAEIAQGRLEMLLAFQTMVADLTGLPLANASLLDEATAAAEAMTMARRISRGKASAFFVDALCHPQTIAVIRTRAAHLGIHLVVGDPLDQIESQDVFGAVFQYPATDGSIRDLRPAIRAVQAKGGLAAVATDLLALTLLTPPGELGADIALGSAQRFGVPIGYGGPHAAFFATKDAHKRAMPGRIIGVSVDARGKPALRMALQTREQHIRREKATSNICTAQVLLAVMASMYAVWHGPDGLTRIAQRIRSHAVNLREALVASGIEVTTEICFDTLTISVPGRADEVVRGFVDRGINLNRVDADRVSLSLDETTTSRTVAAVLQGFGLDAPPQPDDSATAVSAGLELPTHLARTSDFMTHPVFHSHRSETAMLRYLRRLADRDFALDRGMIPLGSCTMKLNATTEMESVSWPEFANLHPFAPADQSEGIRRLIDELGSWLCQITGYDAVSLQPNAGSQGEFSGLLAIHAYHQARGEGHRRICLIPASAHGTNAASAVMAGLKVVVVKTAPDGTVDMGDLRAKVDQHRDDLAAIMVTYPSTHGVYEDTITELCELVHDAGGQVYVDGANLNALVGLAQPGKFGADVSHLNLHKTFCIPHGGGGPGVGPVAVRAHLAPHLPNHPLAPEAGPESGVGPVSAAPYGSASILPISWAYIRLMGGDGLRHATQLAVLNANYVAARLREHYPVLYSGRDGLVAHECILDVRKITTDTGVTVDDIAKRLIDYGFHAPTMSFPVAGTLMVEPTESEDKHELDRFCDAMTAIRDEIEAIHKGDVALAESMLRNAPHTAHAIASGDWVHEYERAGAAFPVGVEAADKYWPPVGRIDGAHGDRHLVCSCPPPEAFEG